MRGSTESDLFVQQAGANGKTKEVSALEKEPQPLSDGFIVYAERPAQEQFKQLFHLVAPAVAAVFIYSFSPCLNKALIALCAYIHLQQAV